MSYVIIVDYFGKFSGLNLKILHFGWLQGTSPAVDKPRNGGIFEFYQKRNSSFDPLAPWCRLLSQSGQVITTYSSEFLLLFLFQDSVLADT